MRLRNFTIGLALALGAFLLPEAGASSSCEGRYAGLLSGPPSARISWSDANEFKRQHSTFSAITTDHNRAYISLAQTQQRPLVFLDVENAILKELNDKVIKDKDLVTAVTNLHKEIYLRRLKEDPVLSKALQAQYSDFKSIRFAFDPEKDLPARLLRVHETSSKEFLERIESLGLRPGPDNARGLALRPENWHLAGIGSSPDEAGAAARRARTVDNSHGTIPPQTFQETLPLLRRTLESTEDLRQTIQALFSNTPGVLDEIRPGVRVLSADAVALIRKIEPSGHDRFEYLAALRNEFEAVFGRKISNDEGVMLRDYVASADRFSPGIFIEKREVIDLSAGKNGIVSADFAGQNARNIRGTMAAMAEQTNPALSLRRARMEEQNATRVLNDRKREFSVRLDQEGHAGSLQFSGDDGIFLPTREVSLEEKSLLARRLASSGYPADLRITFLPERFSDTGAVIPQENRYRLIGLAESVEKSVRKNLQGQIPRERLKQMLFAVDFSPTQNGGDGKARLIVAADAVSSQELAVILAALKKSVDNTGIRQGGVTPAR